MFNDSPQSYFLFLFSHFGLFWELLEKMSFLSGTTLISLKAYESDFTGLLSDIKQRSSTSIAPSNLSFIITVTISYTMINT